MSEKNYSLSTIHYQLIDMHTHILPGADDGARDMEQSLAMAEVAIKDGITMLAATPHVIRGAFNNCKDDILKKVESLNISLEKYGKPLPILPGAEYYLETDLPQRLADGELLTINNTGHYLMVELPAAMVPEYTERILFEIQLQGVTPIIAHPERNAGLARHPELLQAFAERGILAQVTSHSLTGLFGKTVQRTARGFLQRGLIHLIASDGHAVHGRSPVLSQAYQEIKNRWGPQYAQTLTYENPHLIINGHPVPATQQPPGKTWWQRLRR